MAAAISSAYATGDIIGAPADPVTSPASIVKVKQRNSRFFTRASLNCSTVSPGQPVGRTICSRPKCPVQALFASAGNSERFPHLADDRIDRVGEQFKRTAQ